MKKEKKMWFIENYAQKAWTVSLVLSQEAARAGEHGRGYAAVAHDARLLSDKLYEYAAKARFDDENHDFKALVDFTVTLKTLSANALLETIRMVDISMDFNIPKSMAVFADELRRIALAINELSDMSLKQRRLTIPEAASPSKTIGTGHFLLYTIDSHQLIESPRNVAEIVCNPQASEKTLTLRGMEIPILDCYRILGLQYTDFNPGRQTFLIIEPSPGESTKTIAVPVDDLDINAFATMRAGCPVQPKSGHAFAGYARECWDAVGGDQFVFVDWEKLRS